jgi:hypothetical protein
LSSVAKRYVDQAHALERDQRFGDGEIETCSLEFLFDRTMRQERARNLEQVVGQYESQVVDNLCFDVKVLYYR